MKKVFSFRFKEDLIEKARKEAKKEDRPLTNWIERLIKKELKIK